MERIQQIVKLVERGILTSDEAMMQIREVLASLGYDTLAAS